ncbi:MAG: Co2+/Mg2+ efflux protein ApaG [bacterium]|nr:Co2+/Mg2+ efflux protein ApaG [bacterium]
MTAGIRIRVTPTYMPDESSPENGRFLFAYAIFIGNEADHAAQLLSREWKIVDADGEQSMVRGEGVVGQRPVLARGAHFEYSSYCPLATRWGTMEGTFTFQRMHDQTTFDVTIGRFYLVVPEENENV